MIETHVVNFDITTSFEEWVKTYDGSAELQKQAGITSLFRGVNKDDPTKVCAVMQAAPGTMDAFMSANAELIASSGHVLESTIDTIYIG